jgi:hypothetical protein
MLFRLIKLRRLTWAGHVAHMGVKRNTYRYLVVKPEGKILLAKPRKRWENNMKICLTERV